MDKAVVADLKTYIATLIEEQVGGLRVNMEQGFANVEQRFVGVEQRFASMEQRFTEVDQKLDTLQTNLSTAITAVDKKIDDLSEFVGDAFHNFDTATHEQLQNHEGRITKLETGST